jgi:2-polyprenyl-3-methyl-5-hydroxy-6-metoxy-1,4-benzoquinol methylase
MNETERIKQTYEEYKSNSVVAKNGSFTIYIHNIVAERQALYNQIITSHFGGTENIQFLEAGAGGGSNIGFFRSIGIKDENIYANELLEERVAELRSNFQGIHILPGNALKLDYKNKFDIVFQSTVFTSILDKVFKKQLAEKLWDMTKPGGIILWYDFMFDNPQNKSVKGISKKEIKTLFNQSDKIEFYKVTLAPPIGRRFQNLYFFLNSFSFLRTHIIAVIHK